MSRTRTSWLVTTLLAAGAACGGGDDPFAADAAPPPPDAWIDYAGPLYDPARIIEVDIQLAAADWDAMRLQTRGIATLFGNCLAMPFEDPFTYFPGTVTVDGTALTNVGVRKKGFLGSLDTERPSIKLKFNEYVAGQRLLGLKSLTLNNNKQDPAVLRQCLAYRTFNAAGVTAPRCNFARVTVNGVELGVYTNVEAVNKDFLRRTFADASGNLYEGTLSDFRDGWTGTFELKTNKTVNDRTDLDRLVAALEQPDAQVYAAIDAVVDIDQFLSFWATETLVTHYDGYTGNTNNFFAYHDPTSDRFQFMPWGTDGTFQPGQSPWGGAVDAVQANAMLARRLYLLPETRDRYVARLRALMDSAFQESDLLGEIDRIEALIQPVANPGGGPELGVWIEGLRDFARTRRGVIEANLAGGPPVWTAPPPEPLCFEAIGTLSGTFQTTWGTLGAPDPFASGTGTLTGTLDGIPLVTTQVGSTSGLDIQADPPTAQVLVVAWLADGTAELVVFQIDPAAFAPGDLPIDWAGVFGIIYNYKPVEDRIDLIGLFSDGTVHLDMASQAGGAPVTGTFTGTVIRSPF